MVYSLFGLTMTSGTYLPLFFIVILLLVLLFSIPVSLILSLVWSRFANDEKASVFIARSINLIASTPSPILFICYLFIDIEFFESALISEGSQVFIFWLLLSVMTTGSLAKKFLHIISEVPYESIETARALGADRATLARYIVFPIVRRDFLASTLTVVSRAVFELFILNLLADYYFAIKADGDKVGQIHTFLLSCSFLVLLQIGTSLLAKVVSRWKR